MSEDSIKKYGLTLGACFALLILSTQRFSGAYAVILLLPLSIWFLYSIFVILNKPERRKSQLIRVVIWFFTASTLLTVAWYRSEATRKGANEIVIALKEHKIKSGVYPAKLEEIGKDSPLLRKELRLSYSLDEGKPTLIYYSTWVMLDSYDYDFEKSMWILYPD